MKNLKKDKFYSGLWQGDTVTVTHTVLTFTEKTKAVLTTLESFGNKIKTRAFS
jgi:hypothetical protein